RATTTPPRGAAGATKPHPPPPGGAGQPGSSARANAPVTEGCLGGTPQNYTIKDKTGTAYKLNMPPNADTSKLAPHVGESVQVQGEVKDAGTANASINVQAIGRGTGTCPGSGSRDGQPQPKP